MNGDDTPETWQDERRESYYISITDMLIGLLFLFIIMLMYFALQLRTATQDLVTAEDARNDMLRRLVAYMREHNVRAEADLSAGVLRLPDEILFEKGRDEPKAEGAAALRVLADGMTEIMPCYVFQAQPPPATCPEIKHHVEAIFIEGHTDSDPITPTGRIRDNWDLSASRASNTFRLIYQFRPGISGFLSAPPGEAGSRPLMSVAGYADQRPVDSGADEAAKSRNRRIDIRFVMATPTLETVDAPAAEAQPTPAAPSPAAPTPAIPSPAAPSPSASTPAPAPAPN